MRRALRVLIVLLLATPVVAQDPYRVFVQVTVGAAAGGFTLATIQAATSHPQANWAICRLRSAEISYTTDGTTPTSTVGTLLEPGDVLEIKSNLEIRLFSGIRTTSTSGQLDCNLGN